MVGLRWFLPGGAWRGLGWVGLVDRLLLFFPGQGQGQGQELPRRGLRTFHVRTYVQPVKAIPKLHSWNKSFVSYKLVADLPYLAKERT